MHSSLPGSLYDYSKSDYDLWLDRDADVAVDASRMGNEARFVNDYRGVPGKERANAEFRVAWDERRAERVMGVFVMGVGKKGKGKGGIAKGEEVLVSYGRGFWGERKSGGGGDDGWDWEDGEGSFGEEGG